MTALPPIKSKIRRAPREERCKILVTGYLLIKA